MKAGMTKYVSHEVEYIIAVTVVLIILSLLVFPIFIVLLPIAIIVGCSGLWKVDHLTGKK